MLKICFAENSVFQIPFAKRSIFSHYRAHLCRQKKKAYLSTHFQNCGRVRENRNIFNCGLIQIHRKHWTQDTEWRQKKPQHRKQKSWTTQITSKTKPLFISQTIAFHFLNLEKQIVKRQRHCHFAVKSKIFIIL